MWFPLPAVHTKRQILDSIRIILQAHTLAVESERKKRPSIVISVSASENYQHNEFHLQIVSTIWMLCTFSLEFMWSNKVCILEFGHSPTRNHFTEMVFVISRMALALTLRPQKCVWKTIYSMRASELKTKIIRGNRGQNIWNAMAWVPKSAPHIEIGETKIAIFLFPNTRSNPNWCAALDASIR